jgi:allophanate hydrolase subunit 2
MAGAVQIPPEGQPVLFLADHPITGGYPVIGVVVDHQLDMAAQVPVGGSIRFRWAPGYGQPTSFSASSPDISQTPPQTKVSN